MAIIVTEQFAIQHNGYKSGVNEFFARQTIAGEWACDDNSEKEFPEIFKETNFERKELTLLDFPQSMDI